MKKQWISGLLLLAMSLLLFTACAGDGTASGSESQTTPAVTTTQSPTSQTTAAPEPTTPQRVSLEGKRIVWLGSSVTYGSATGGKSMVEYLAETTGCRSYKYAVSGTTLVDNDSGSYVSRLKNAARKQGKNCDYFICQLSTNDASQNKPLGTVSESFEMDDFDTQTVCGAIEYIIAFAKKKWNCTIAFYTGPRYNSPAYQKMVDALLEIQKKWNIQVLDFWNDPDFLAMSAREQQQWLAKYMSDDIHPNAKGYEEWWTPAFEEFISTTYGQKVN